MTAAGRYDAELNRLARTSRRNALVSALSGALILFSFYYARVQFSRVQAKVIAADSIFARLVRSNDSAQHHLDSLKAAVADARASLAAAQRDLAGVTGAQSAQHALRRASTQLGAAIKQPATSTTPTGDTLPTIRKVIPFTGTLNPGSPVVVSIRLPYRASLTYRRWISQDKVDTLGIVDPANLELELPYGGYLYFEARNTATGEVASRAADCRHRWCNVSFE